MKTAVLTCLVLLAGPCLAADPSLPSDAQMLERATALRSEAAELRVRADREEALKKPECNQSFQVNRCLQLAREARLVDVKKARKLEHEAHQLELGVKRRQAASTPTAEPAGIDTTNTPAPPLRIKARTTGPASSDAPDARQARDAKLADQRQKEQAAAARRAARAQADRERYDARLRAYEEKQPATK